MESDKLIVGESYIIDKGFRNSGKIKLVKIYGKLFCRVCNEESGYEWDTMINRLTKLEQTND